MFSRLQTGAAVLFSTISLLGISSASATDAYPSKPVHIIVPFAAGGPGDILARLVASELQNTLKQTVVVENRPGANGEPGTEYAAKAEPDGYTVLQVSTVQTISMALRPNLRYDLLRDFEPVSYTFEAPLVLLTPGTSPNRSVESLITDAKSRPEGLTYGTGGVGTVGHLTAERIKEQAGINALNVPYKGNGAAVGDLIGGRLDFFLATIAESASNIKSGRLHALAVTSPNRDSILPDVPTLAEKGFPDLSTMVSWGFMVPRNTPTPIVEKLHQGISAAIASSSLQERLVSMGITSNVRGPQELESSIRKDLDVWKRTIQTAGITPE